MHERARIAHERAEATRERIKEQEREYEERAKQFYEDLQRQQLQAAAWAQLTSRRPTIFSVTLLLTLLNTAMLAFLIYHSVF